MIVSGMIREEALTIIAAGNLSSGEGVGQATTVVPAAVQLYHNDAPRHFYYRMRKQIMRVVHSLIGDPSMSY